MTNRPYPPSSLGAVGTLLLKRLEVAEKATVQMAALIAQQLPSSKTAVDKILAAASGSAYEAEDAAAAIYLQSLYYQGVAVYETQTGRENLIAFQAMLAKYFPMQHGQASPLAFEPLQLLKVFGSHQVFPSGESTDPDYDQLVAAVEESCLLDETPGGLFNTSLINTTNRAVPTLVFKTSGFTGLTGGNFESFVAIAPMQGLFDFIALDAEESHYFAHKQAQYFSIPQIDQFLKNAFLKEQPVAIRSHYAMKGNGVTRVQVLLAQIAALYDVNKISTLHEMALYDNFYNVKVHCVTWHDTREVGLAIVAGHSRVQAFLKVNQSSELIFRLPGDPADCEAVVKLKDLPAVSLTILEKVLKEVLKVLKPTPKTSKSK